MKPPTTFHSLVKRHLSLKNILNRLHNSREVGKNEMNFKVIALQIFTTLPMILVSRAAVIFEGQNCAYDIAFAIDETNSLGQVNFSILTNTVADTAMDLGANPATDVQYGAVRYANDAHIVTPLTPNTSVFAATIQGMAYTAGTGANFTAALQQAGNLVENGRAGVSKAVVLFTDGRNTVGASINAVNTANSLRASGITILVVGIGNGVNSSELISIAGGDEELVDFVTFAQLQDPAYRETLVTSIECICAGNTIPEPSSAILGLASLGLLAFRWR